MTEAGRRALLLLLLVGAGALAVRALRPPALGSPSPRAPCAVAAQFPDGVRCLDESEAARLGVRAGDRVRSDGTRGRMAAARLELFAVALDLNRAPVDELASLPGIGPSLAARIASARPFRSVEELARVRGIGRRRARAIAARLFVSDGN